MAPSVLMHNARYPARAYNKQDVVADRHVGKGFRFPSPWQKTGHWGEAPLAGAPGCYPGRCWFESNRPSFTP